MHSVNTSIEIPNSFNTRFSINLSFWVNFRRTLKPGHILMVLISDGNSAIGAHVRSNLRYVTCLTRSTRVVNMTFFYLRKRPVHLLTCPSCSTLPSDIITTHAGGWNEGIPVKKFNWQNKMGDFYISFFSKD